MLIKSQFGVTEILMEMGNAFKTFAKEYRGAKKFKQTGKTLYSLIKKPKRANNFGAIVVKKFSIRWYTFLVSIDIHIN